MKQRQYLSFFTEENGYVKCKEYESYDDCREELKFMLDSAIFSPQYYNFHICIKNNNWRETGKLDTWVLKYY
jgi:hypothetical protein